MNAAANYVAMNEWLIATTGMSHPLAHVHAGLAIYLFMQFILRTRRASIIALHAVWGAEIGNEIMEWAHYGSWRLPDTLGDIALTVFWPTALYLLGTYRRSRWRADRASASRQAEARAMMAFAELSPATVRDGGSPRRLRNAGTSR